MGPSLSAFWSDRTSGQLEGPDRTEEGSRWGGPAPLERRLRHRLRPLVRRHGSLIRLRVLERYMPAAARAMIPGGSRVGSPADCLTTWSGDPVMARRKAVPTTLSGED